MSETIPEFAFPTERFLVSGYGEHAVHLDPTIICKYSGKVYLAHESLIQFAQLITSATTEEQQKIVKALESLKPYSCSNVSLIVKVEELELMRDANILLVNKYLDHLKEISE